MVKLLFWCVRLIMKKMFIRTLKGEIYKKMTAKNSNSNLDYLDNELIDQNNNIYHGSIVSKPINACYSALPEESKSNLKASEFSNGDRLRVTK